MACEDVRAADVVRLLRAEDYISDEEESELSAYLKSLRRIDR